MTEQEAELPEPDNVQLVELKLPAPLDVKLTVPVGVVGEADVSVTVAVQLVVVPTGSVAGLQLTEVVVVCAFAVTVAVPVDTEWFTSPP